MLHLDQRPKSRKQSESLCSISSPIFIHLFELETIHLLSSSTVLTTTQYNLYDINIPHKSRSIPHRTHPVLSPQWQTPSPSSSRNPIVKCSHPHSSNFWSGQNRNGQWVTRRIVTSFEQEAKNVDLLAYHLPQQTRLVKRGSKGERGGTCTESASSTLPQSHSYPASCLSCATYANKISPRETLSLRLTSKDPHFVSKKRVRHEHCPCCHAR